MFKEGVAKHGLDHPHVDAAFEHQRGHGVPNKWHEPFLSMPAAFTRLLTMSVKCPAVRPSPNLETKRAM